MEFVTRDVALYHTGTFHHVHLKNADDTPVRCCANGACKTWRRDPTRFRLPVKHGLRQCFYIEPHNAVDWQITDDDWREVRRKMLCDRLGVQYHMPREMLCDLAIERGVDDQIARDICGLRRNK